MTMKLFQLLSEKFPRKKRKDRNTTRQVPQMPAPSPQLPVPPARDDSDIVRAVPGSEATDTTTYPSVDTWPSSDFGASSVYLGLLDPPNMSLLSIPKTPSSLSEFSMSKCSTAEPLAVCESSRVVTTAQQPAKRASRALHLRQYRWQLSSN